jgi:uncharacterized protein (DUF924 family)
VTTLPDTDGVLAFWFGEAFRDPAAARVRGDRWFVGDAALDADIVRRFGPLYEAARAGALGAWEGTPRSALALVLVLDQFPRNMFRGTAGAFATDGLALGVATRAVARGLDAALAPIGRCFLYLPFQHAEDLVVQARAVALYERLATDAPPAWRETMNTNLAYANDHYRVIARFGRFPHRNACLGRESSPSEEAYLAAGATRYGQ